MKILFIIHSQVRDIRNKTKMNVEDENLRQNGVYANVTDESSISMEASCHVQKQLM